MFKINFLKLLFLVTSINLTAQIGIGTSSPDASSILDVESNSKGFLPPRMTESQRDNINGQNIAEGLLIYNTDENCINFYNGSDWISLCNTGGGSTSTPANVPTGMLINSDNKINYIASVFDVDYLPYTAPTAPANTSLHSPNTATTETTVDLPGILTTTGITVNLPYTITGSVDYDAYDYNVDVPAALTEDGIAGTINFHYDGVMGATGSGNITMTIKAVGGDINLKKLDINRGIGDGTATEGNITTGVFGVLIAEAPFYVDDQSTTKYIQLRDIPGIPDRRFGDETTQGTAGLGFYHNNLYLPVTLSNGQTWLKNDLGAMYTDVTNSNFNIAGEATSHADINAYGSKYQWGRFSDGHELIDFTTIISGKYTPVNPGLLKPLSNTHTPAHKEFIKGGSAAQVNGWFDKNIVDIHTLWQGADGINNPCPFGFKVPTRAEWTALLSDQGFTNSNNSTAATNDIKLVADHGRDYGTGDLYNAVALGFGGYGDYWTSDTDVSWDMPYEMQLFTSANNPSLSLSRSGAAQGNAIRCIQE